MSVNVLLIEDSETERAVTMQRLERAGYQVTVAVDGTEGLRKLYDARPDLVLLDVMMPGRDGWKTLELIREVSAVPVIMLTGRDSSVERVRGLKSGADDYIGKPYDAPELLARMEALLRRAGERSEVQELWDDGVVRVDYRASEVTVNGAAVSLTPLEFRLLSALVQHAGQVLSRDQLLELVWGDVHTRSREQVKLYIGYLRRKLGADDLIETVRGFGYRYVKR